MKQTKLLRLGTIAITLLLISTVTSSCTKEKIIVQKDTVVVDSILTSSPWHIEEAFGVYGGSFLKYKRGSTTNNWYLDSDYWVFFPDHTGYVNDGKNARHEIKNWALKDSAGRILLETILVNDARFPYITTKFTWDYLQIKNGQLKYVDYYNDTYSGYNYHGQATRSRK